MKVIALLQHLGAKLRIYDPYYKGETINNFKVCNSLDEALNNTSAIAVLTDHDEFKKIDFTKVIEKNKSLILVDSRNIYNSESLPPGTIYCGVGRPIKQIYNVITDSSMIMIWHE